VTHSTTQGRCTVELESMMADFETLEALEAWIEQEPAQHWRVTPPLHTKLIRAWEAIQESLALGYPKDYHVVVSVRVYLKRKGPKQPRKLARQTDQQQEQWREERKRREQANE